MSDDARPTPEPDLDTQGFWDACKAHEVRVQRCRACQRFRWPPQSICSHCHSFEFDWVKMNPRGVLYTYTVVYYGVVPAFAAVVPYINARVTIDGTDDRVHIPGLLVDCSPERAAVGMPVEILFDDVASDCSLPKFKPLAGP